MGVFMFGTIKITFILKKLSFYLKNNLKIGMIIAINFLSLQLHTQYRHEINFYQKHQHS